MFYLSKETDETIAVNDRQGLWLKCHASFSKWVQSKFPWCQTSVNGVFSIYLSHPVQKIHKAAEPSGASHLSGVGFPVGDSESGITSEGLSTKLQV